MSGWSPEDSNLNTVCLCCKKPTVPLLTICVNQPGSPPGDPFSVPYLNPLVLRKELENILSQEGDLSLAEAKFIEEHPIIYWNLVWAFERINVQTHLPNLCLKNRVDSVCNKTSTDMKKDEVVETGNGTTEEGNNVMQPVEEGADPLTQELATVGK